MEIKAKEDLFRTLRITAEESFDEALKSFLREGFKEYTPVNRDMVRQCLDNFTDQGFETALVECEGNNPFCTIFYRKGEDKKRIWIYTYLRADKEEIDMGPYGTNYETEKAMKEHVSFGALTSGPFEKPSEYKLYKGTLEE